MKRKKIIINLGCGKTRIPGSVGVDVVKIDPFVDIVHNLDSLPYPFPANYADELHMYHVLEHLTKPDEKMEELYRILKPGGVLHLRVPHFSSMGAFSDITHVRPFGYTSFDYLDPSDYHHFYSRGAKFNIVEKKIKFSGLYPNTGVYERYIHRNECIWVARPFVRLINFFIGISPLFFERVWCYWVGGATEVVFCLQKKTGKR